MLRIKYTSQVNITNSLFFTILFTSFTKKKLYSYATGHVILDNTFFHCRHSTIQMTKTKFIISTPLRLTRTKVEKKKVLSNMADKGR